MRCQRIISPFLKVWFKCVSEHKNKKIKENAIHLESNFVIMAKNVTFFA